MRNTYEKQKLNSGYANIIGCDEVGRGCLAGPVVAAAVILPVESFQLKVMKAKEINDSKLLQPEKREELSELIKQNSVAWGIGVIEREIIDELNIHYASLRAMNKAVENLISFNAIPRSTADEKSFILGRQTKGSLHLRQGFGGQVGCTRDGSSILLCIDGKFTIPQLNIQQEAIIKGDAKVLSIAAASIIAKVYRDNLMRELDKDYPKYKFAQHKGYATIIHRAAIKRFGLTPLHRLSFCGQYL